MKILEKEIIMSRRDFNKATLISAGLFMGLPSFAKGSIAKDPIGIEEDDLEYTEKNHLMVVVIKNKEMRVYKDTEEIVITDSSIINKFEKLRGEYKEPFVILVNEDRSIGFKDEEVIDIDKGMKTEMINTFGGIGKAS